MWWFVLDRFLSNSPNIGAAYITPNKTISSQKEQQYLFNILNQPDAKAEFTGWSYVMADLVPWSKHKLAELSIAMVLFNIVLLVLLYRAPKPLLVLMFSLLLSMGAMVAGLKITGLSLNLFNVLAFPLVLGVGVDYGIYVVLAVRQMAHEKSALATILKPILLSGLTTIAGFGSLGLANNPSLSGLGLVCALGVACCLFSTLFFILPAYLWRGYR
jgi:predicted RND superfamily exporter protein